MADTAGMGQDVPIADPEEIVQLGDPVAHILGFPVEGLQFGKVQIHGYNPV
jgi:hypothetical protein